MWLHGDVDVSGYTPPPGRLISEHKVAAILQPIDEEDVDARRETTCREEKLSAADRQVEVGGQTTIALCRSNPVSKQALRTRFGVEQVGYDDISDTAFPGIPRSDDNFFFLSPWSLVTH